MQEYRIVILDDDIDEIFFLRDAFIEKGVHYIKYFTDGEKCIEYLNSCSDDNLPNAVITDLNMPRISGYEFLKWIKAIDRFNHIPVVVYSTAQTQGFIDLCINLGAKEYIVKPFLHSEYYTMAERIKNVAAAN